MYGVVVLSLLVAVAAGQTYVTKYDTLDLDDILSNKRLLASYHNCLLDKATCPPDGEELKKHLPEALSNGCAKCSDRQKEGAKKVLTFLYTQEPEMFKALEAKYDPGQVYRQKYKEEAARAGIKV